MTPRRTIAIAVLTFVAVVASPSAAGVITGLLVPGDPGRHSTFAHALWHLLWAVLTVAIALGIHRLRRAWLATGSTERDPTLRLQSSPRGSTEPAPDLFPPVRLFGMNQYQLLAGARLFVIALAAGQFLASAGAIDFNQLYFAIVHTTGEFLVIGSFGSLLLVCLHMLGVGVRGALRPAGHSS